MEYFLVVLVNSVIGAIIAFLVDLIAPELVERVMTTATVSVLVINFWFIAWPILIIWWLWHNWRSKPDAGLTYNKRRVR